MPAPARIVVGVDGSDSSRAALRWAADQAKRTGAELDVVFAWRHPEASFAPAYALPPQQDLEEAARKTCEKIIGDEGFARVGDLQVNPIVVQGAAAQMLLEAAKGADLLVVGSRGRGAFTGMLLGSVSQHCVAHAPCSVAVIRTPTDE